MSGDIKLRFIKAVITTGNELKRLFPSIKQLQDSSVCQEFILHVEQADWQNANRLSTAVAAVVRAARLRSAAAGEFATALEAYRQATNATLSILQVEAIEAKQAAKAQSDFVADVALERMNEAIEQASAKASERDERDRRIEAMLSQAVEQSQQAEVESDDARNQPSKPYPQPKLLQRDTFIWKNITTMTMPQLIQALKIEKNFGAGDSITTNRGFKQAALRYSQHHRLPTRNFKQEIPYSPSGTD